MDEYKWVPIREAAKYYGVKPGTLRSWDSQGKIKTKRSPTGQRKFLIPTSYKPIGKSPKIERKKICYCRVSSPHQKDDLKRQIEFMRKKFPEYEIWHDVGSGLNWNRPKFNQILECSKKGDISEVVVAHRDRLCRFAFELVENMLGLFDTKILVLDQGEYSSKEQELSEDLFSIIQVYISKRNGRRRYSENKDSKNNQHVREADEGE